MSSGLATMSAVSASSSRCRLGAATLTPVGGAAGRLAGGLGVAAFAAHNYGWLCVGA